MTGGFGEKPQAAYDPAPSGDPAPAADAGRAKVKLGPGGRIVIPAAMREALGVVEGDTLVLTLGEGGLAVCTMAEAVRRAQAMVRAVVPTGVSLADELIADRRREVERERGR